MTRSASAIPMTHATDTSSSADLRDRREPSDEALALAAGRDESLAFDRLARRLQVPLLRFLLRSTPTREDAEDALQETFARLYASRAQFKSGLAYRPWAFTIARRAAIDQARKRARTLSPARFDDTHAAPIARAGDDDAAQIWNVARRTLSPEQVQALWLFYVESMPAGEIARVLGRSWASVKTMLMRARRRLRGPLTRTDINANACAARRNA